MFERLGPRETIDEYLKQSRLTHHTTVEMSEVIKMLEDIKESLGRNKREDYNGN
jgi:hypothetical protein